MIPNAMRSLSARLLGVFLITSLVYALASRLAVDLVLDRDYLREIVGAHISLHTNYVVRDIGWPPSIERARAITDHNPFDIRIDGPGIDWASDPNFPAVDDIPFEPSRFLEQVRASGSDGESWARTLEQLDFARHDRHSYVLISHGKYRVTFVSPKIATRPPPDFTWPIVGLVSILVLGSCYLAVRWLVQPIKLIKEGADRMGEGDLDYRIPVVRQDDLGDLTQEINHLAEDVQQMLEAKRQLLLAISHELRSPLTRTKVALEFLEDESTRGSILEDVEEMERLINDLLEGERLNTRHQKLQLGRVELNQLMQELLAVDFADDEDRIALDLPDVPVVLTADAMRIRLLIKNLVSNALAYSAASSPPVRVDLAVGQGHAVIAIVDQGSGMSAKQLERATEPFYRADPARSRDTGGFGLGLYLCRRIAEAHGGQLAIESAEGRGTTVTVRLPLENPESVAA